MESKENPKESNKNKITLLYIIGIFILLRAVRILLKGDIIQGVIYILIGIQFIPVTGNAIEKILIRILKNPGIADAIEKNNVVLTKIILLITNCMRCFLIFVFLLGGVGYLSMGEIIPGVLFILIGIMFIPVIEDLIEKKINL